MRKIYAVAAALWLSSSTTAFAQEFDEDNEVPAPDSLGVTAGLEFGYFSADSFFDNQGENREFIDGISNDSLYILLHARYDVAQIPGLYAGLELPFVSNSTSVVGGVDASASSIGDVAFFAGYTVADVLPDIVDAYGQLRLKLPTGSFDNLAADETATGDGSMHLHFTAGADATLPANLRAHVDLGYILTLGFTQEQSGFTTDTNPGDVFFSPLAT
ncbi:MAG: hypothetical protein AAFU77_00455 [Myxococcota bacterium]